MSQGQLETGTQLQLGLMLSALASPVHSLHSLLDFSKRWIRFLSAVGYTALGPLPVLWQFCAN